jgi:peptidoglycan/LPS O-acetylase OafA/YrhL
MSSIQVGLLEEGNPALATEPPALADRAAAQASPRFYGIESLRGLAALAIVAQHARGSLLTTGRAGDFTAELAYGVSVFFVISGFVLYRPHVARRLLGREPVDAARFIRRRVARIVPAYFAVLAVAAVIVPGPGWLGLGGWKYLAFGQTFTWHAHQQSIDAGIGQTWSVAIEVWFYVGLAALFAIWAFRRMNALAEAALLGAALTVTTALLLPHFADAGVWWNVWLPSLAAFLCGMVLATAHAHGSAWLHRLLTRPLLLLSVGLAALLLAGLRPSYYALAGVVFAVAVVTVGIGAERVGRTRVLLDPRLIAVGTISYGIYLWHQPLLFSLRGGASSVHGASAVAGTVVALGLTAALAALSWRFLERPVLRRVR